MSYRTELPIREDLSAAHAAVVDGWSKPGGWWNAAERLAIVEEVRHARDAEAAPPPWVPASTVDGIGGIDHPLPAAAIDATWRLTNHPGTLTSDWYEGIVGPERPSAISPFQYAELVGIVAQANCIDRFADGLSLERVSLAEPADGEPTQIVPDAADVRDHWVPTVDTEGPQVLRALSGVPHEKATMFVLSDAQYMPIATMQELVGDRNSLTRMQVELVAARTSKLNECFY